jgi:hypothetical protein
MDQILTKTVAEIYLQQGHFREAYKIFRVLLEKDPSDPDLIKKISELDEKLRPPSTDEQVEILKGWLANIRKRKRK